MKSQYPDFTFHETEILMNPHNQHSLTLQQDKYGPYLSDVPGNRVPIVNGIPNFLALDEPDGLNKEFREFYDKVSKYSITWIITSFLENTLMNRQRKEWMKNVKVKDGWKVLETSIGSGWNTKTLTANAHYFGLDISRGMLSRCQENNRKWKKKIRLIQANAEYLPFKDETFDCVFQIGGINFFSDRKRAIMEMIRVAKPNAQIVIMDETEKTVKSYYERLPLLARILKDNKIGKDRMTAPVELIPPDMQEVTSKIIFKKMMYVLSFRKPGTNRSNSSNTAPEN